MAVYEVADVDGAFAGSVAGFAGMLAELGDPLADVVSHDELEGWLQRAGRSLLRSLLQEHLDLRAAREVRRADVVAAGEVRARTRVESGHVRVLTTVFGPVMVRRLAYRAAGARNLYPADAVLNLPEHSFSHGLRRLAAVEAGRGSFEQAQAAIGRATGVVVGKRQVEALAARAVADVEGFWAGRRPSRCPDDVALVLTFDGKGVVMRPGSLRPATAKAAARGGNKLGTRLSRGEKRNRKRMAEVGCVYDAVPGVRTPADVLARGDTAQAPAPVAAAKWLTASVEADAAEVIATGFDEAERRDPGRRRDWIVLVDGQAWQIDAIQAEAARRHVTVTIVADFVHVLEYLWKAGWCFFTEGDRAIEDWIARQARRLLEGHADAVADTIRRTADANGLDPARRRNADTAAGYLQRLAPHLRYDHALANGWPIATGIIEGAVRHLVKDRMDITGARWSLTGAETILQLRTLIANGELHEYWRHHLRQQQHRNHTSRYRDNLTLAA